MRSLLSDTLNTKKTVSGSKLVIHKGFWNSPIDYKFSQ